MYNAIAEHTGKAKHIKEYIQQPSASTIIVWAKNKTELNK